MGDTGQRCEDAAAGLERIRAYYADLQAKCPHPSGFWRDGQTMCLACNAVDAVVVSGRHNAGGES